MYYVVCAVMILWGLFLTTPGGARAALNWRRLGRRGQQPAHARSSEIRSNRIAGVVLIVGVTAIMLTASL